MRSSRTLCSSTVSTSFKVETRCCASTSRQQVPERGRASDDSAAGVQVLDDIHETWNGLDQGHRLVIEQGIAVAEPGAGNRIVTAHDRIQGAVEAHEQQRQLEGLLTGLQLVLAGAH